MRRLVITLSIATIAASLTGCASLSRSDQAMLRELESYGVSPTDQSVKHPAAAGAEVLSSLVF